jgi:hypothetical protein
VYLEDFGIMVVNRRVVVAAANANNVYLLDESIPDIVQFDPPLAAPETNLGGWAIWGSPTGELITHARRTSDNTYYFYHYEGGVSWTAKAGATGAVWDIYGTSYQDVWGIAGDGHGVWHFDGNSWTWDITLAPTDRMTQVFATGTGLDEVFIAAKYSLWFRTGGAIGSGTWVDRAPQFFTDTGIVLSGSTLIAGVWAVSKTEVYWLLQGHPSGNNDGIIKWNGSNFSNVAAWPTGAPSASVSESSFHATSSSDMWYVQADSSWGRRHFCHFDGSVITRQEAQHGMDFGMELIMETSTRGFAAGGGTTPNRVAVWDFNGSVWDHLKTLTVASGGGAYGIGLWKESSPPVLQNQSPAPDDISVILETSISLEITDIDDDIDASSVILAVDGTTAWQNEAEQPGFTVNISSVTDGYRYEISPDANFDSHSIIQVDIDAYDGKDNYLDAYYSFLTMDTGSSEINNEFPVPGASNVVQNSLVSVAVFDRRTGVDFSSIEVQINGRIAYNGSFISPYDGYNSSISPTVVDGYDGYNIVLDRTTPFISSERIDVEVFGLNKDGY